MCSLCGALIRYEAPQRVLVNKESWGRIGLWRGRVSWIGPKFNPCLVVPELSYSTVAVASVVLLGKKPFMAIYGNSRNVHLQLCILLIPGVIRHQAGWVRRPLHPLRNSILCNKIQEMISSPSFGKGFVFLTLWSQQANGFVRNERDLYQ